MWAEGETDTLSIPTDGDLGHHSYQLGSQRSRRRGRAEIEYDALYFILLYAEVFAGYDSACLPLRNVSRDSVLYLGIYGQTREASGTVISVLLSENNDGCVGATIQRRKQYL